MVCPLCGELTQMSSTRLIQDACGHMKCRMCLLKEENGCRACEDLTIDSIGSFNYPLPTGKSPNYEFPNCTPLELAINKIPVNLEMNDLPQSVEKEMTVNENNSHHQNDDILIETNFNVQESEDNNIAENQNTDTQKALTSKTINFVENRNDNDSDEIYDLNAHVTLVIDEEREENADDTQNENLNNKNLQNKNETNENQIAYQDNSSIISCLTENLNHSVNSEVKSSSSIPVPQKSLATKLVESEKSNSDLPNATPKQSCTNLDPKLLDSVGSSPFRSPAFRFSDYLTFNNQNEKNDASPLSVNYRSPAFRLSDYIVFKDRSSQDDVRQRIEKDLNEEERKSGDYITSDGFLVQRIPAGSQSLTVEIEDNLENNYFNETNTAIDNSSTVSDTPSCSPLSKTFMPNSTVNSNSNQSQNNCDLKDTKSTSIKQVKNRNGKKEDDEDKENNKRKNKEETTKKSTKVHSDDEIAALKKINLPLKRKSKNINTSKTKSNKRKKKEENVKLDKPVAIRRGERKRKRKVLVYENEVLEDCVKSDDASVATRRGERKRKRKVLIYENEVLEVVTKKRNYRSSMPKKSTPKKKVSRPNIKWNHVTRLSGNPKSYECNVCKAKFSNWRGRLDHAACRENAPPFTCEICDRHFYKGSHYEYHQRTHTGEKPYVCELCNKSFSQKNKLNRHFIVHKQQQDIECAMCGKRFQSKQYLKQHLVIHQENAPKIKCSICSKTFTSTSNCRRHELSHTTGPMHNCNICLKGFKSKYVMARHNKLHSATRSFKCDQCGRHFYTKFEVKRHIITHTDSKPFSCDVCKINFRRQDNLQRHIMDHHPADLQEYELDSSENGDQQSPSPGPSTSGIPIKNWKKQRGAKKMARPKRIPKTITKRSNKISPESSEINTSSTLVPLSFRPSTSTFQFVDDIPREEARLLNQQIELKLQAQKSFCNFPGLSRKVDLHPRSESSKKKSKSSNVTAVTQNQDKKNEKLSSDEPSSSETYVHWRRRTANRLCNKSKQDLEKNT